MSERQTASKVHVARSYEEARAIEIAAEPRSLQLLGLRAALSICMAGLNMAVWSARKLAFPRRSGPADVRDVAVYTVGTLGDNVLLLPAVAAVKRRFPAARLTVITNCDEHGEYAARAVYAGLSFVDRFISVPRHPVVREGWRLRVTSPELAAIRCDLFVNLSPFGNRGSTGAVLREVALAKHLGAHRVVGFGMSSYNHGVFRRVRHRFVRNEARRTRHVLAGLGITPAFGEDLLRQDPEARERVLSILARHRTPDQPLVVLTPGAKLRASQWPPERFGEVASRLTRDCGACVVLNGTAAEREICSQVRVASGDTVVDLAGELEIQELVELLRFASASISNNTGPMTLAAALNVPSVVIASSRYSPALFMPVSDRMAWLFALDGNTYSYDDRGGPSSDLLHVQAADVLEALSAVTGLVRSDRRVA